MQIISKILASGLIALVGVGFSVIETQKKKKGKNQKYLNYIYQISNVLLTLLNL